jgi:hypothetical protein
MVFTNINSFQTKLILQDIEIKNLTKQNIELETKLKELNLEVEQLKKLLNNFIN